MTFNRPPRALTRAIAWLAALALVLLAGAAAWQWAAPARPAPEALAIGVALNPAFALVFVAEARGFLREEGLQPSYHRFALGRDALASALRGESDVATVYDIPLALRIAEGEDLAILGTLHRSREGHAIVARSDRGIAVPADLRGRKVGVTKGISTDYFLTEFLAGEGIAPAAIVEVPLDPADYERALLGGAVDALVAYGPYIQALRGKLGKGGAAVFHSSAYEETSVLAARREVVAAKRAAIERLLRALARAEDFVRADPDEAIRITAAALGGHFSEPAVRAGWRALEHRLRLDHVLLAGLAQEAQWLRDTGRFAGPVPDFARHVAAEPLARARPLAVTLPHRAAARQAPPP